ncbi:hypothetical protein GCM10023185_16430 [Hymenobacter saemangeumensis]|uniref:ER-bound oxygenase mpaB/mpaB'/Rubber oxygenase catalytic domain-containing protein n=1 Tax=Hymenobacter saemangeumensis TaxID=1084522 RepID=A0ABP8IAI0_9BACT
MEYFVPANSVVRTIWGKADTVLFIFAGAAAEFALNKAVDWLYFTGRLPADPLGRLFSTVEYARQIVFAEREGAERAIAGIAAIHAAVEAKRGAAIPDWAYRDVLYMLIDYSIRAFELLERPLTAGEKEQVFTVFWRVGQGLGIPDLPLCYTDWLPEREQRLKADLEYSRFTADLYQQYRRHLGLVRYQLLRRVQALVVPQRVRHMLNLQTGNWLRPVLATYCRTRHLALSQWARALLLPEAYRAQIAGLDIEPKPVLTRPAHTANALQ